MKQRLFVWLQPRTRIEVSASQIMRQFPTEGDVGIAGSPTPAEPTEGAPTTSIVSCKIDDGLPVAEVKVTNSTDQAAAFSVEVQFASGDSILGSGTEYTEVLELGQNQTIRMGSMQGDAAVVDACKVIDTSPIAE